MPGDDSVFVQGINNRGAVVGQSLNVGELDEIYGEPAVWTLGSSPSVCALESVGGLNFPTAINEHGQVAGGYLENWTFDGPQTFYRAVSWAGCGQKAVTLPGNNDQQAFGINDVGRIVGVGRLYTNSPYGIRWDR